MNQRIKRIRILEEQLNVSFENIDLLNTALTHSSFVNQKKHIDYNERLEFLGDSVLQLTISEYLFKELHGKSEGELTRLRSLIVCENSLHSVGRDWNIGNFLLMSKGEELTGGRSRTSILADAVEAVIAAIYLDKGYDAAREFILLHFKEVINLALDNKIVLDYKTRLQEVLQKDGEISIAYKLEKYDGPPHRRRFFVNLEVANKVLGSGEGFSKKEAEQMAAKEVLLAMENKNEE
ncbi:ribonuclease III [Clostridium cellulovorans]|uniref:Ribonuclease 3 n=1 Tax=Clostridium cellulovorans (strain ATCC 35296 / DSM 3052 / OCM 3 / 743B) TaxID=573061 RepID=D9SLC5_CLOC7|nr:ribonuclease III [Clostridium cellulovorans]ADL51641.1 ribonuclease III [Clostridium cellulovorans 743B]